MGHPLVDFRGTQLSRGSRGAVVFSIFYSQCALRTLSLGHTHNKALGILEPRLRLVEDGVLQSSVAGKGSEAKQEGVNRPSQILEGRKWGRKSTPHPSQEFLKLEGGVGVTSEAMRGL